MNDSSRPTGQLLGRPFCVPECPGHFARPQLSELQDRESVTLSFTRAVCEHLNMSALSAWGCRLTAWVLCFSLHSRYSAPTLANTTIANLEGCLQASRPVGRVLISHPACLLEGGWGRGLWQGKMDGNSLGMARWGQDRGLPVPGTADYCFFIRAFCSLHRTR